MFLSTHASTLTNFTYHEKRIQTSTKKISSQKDVGMSA